MSKQLFIKERQDLCRDLYDFIHIHENGESLENFNIVCTFGTGGTSGGLSRYFDEKYSKKGVHVIFPPDQQDVAGIKSILDYHDYIEGLNQFHSAAKFCLSDKPTKKQKRNDYED